MSLNQTNKINPDINYISSLTETAVSGRKRSEVTEQHERKVINEIVDRIFDDQLGYHSLSSSVCLTPEPKRSVEDVDKRLKYWKDMLDERKRITQRIQEKVGKPAQQVLFNRTTIEDREKNMVKRLLDYSERVSAEKVAARRLLVLREYCQLPTCRYVNELEETLPRPERQRTSQLEISGMPAIAKKEQVGNVPPCAKSAWLESDVLENSIVHRCKDIENVVEFYPDIERLEVVGRNVLETEVKHNPEIELFDEDIIKSISDETTPQQATTDCKIEEKVIKPEQLITYGIKVNEHVYVMGVKKSVAHVEIGVNFECFPYENVVKRVLHLENIGKKILNVELIQKNHFRRVAPLLRSVDEEFVMDVNPFRLIPGEKRDIIVLYQPRRVDVVKQMWILKLEPHFFCRRSDAITLRLSGHCKPPIEYAMKMNGILKNVIEKSNVKMMKKLGNNLASLAPLIQDEPLICPYKRSLDEREIFEQLNTGYTCERYHDLELLKDIHRRVKKPREPAWNLQLDTLYDQIMRVEIADRRALIFNEYLGILENMKGKPSSDLEAKVEVNPDRERTRFLYVRGVICAGVEEWETMALGIEETFVKQAIKLYILEQEQARGDGYRSKAQPPRAVINDALEQEIRPELTKKVHRQKPFRDSLYLQTYALVGNFVEDIVAVIESTELF